MRRALALACGLALAGCGSAPDKSGSTATPAAGAGAMTLSSPDIKPGATLDAAFTCDGAGFSPELLWSNPPEGTRGFMLLLDDPDAPGGTFNHWGAYNLASDRRDLPPGAGSEGAEFPQAKNDFGKIGYGPPCPPRGDPPHRYRFRLFALDVDRLSGSRSGGPPDIPTMMENAQGHVLGSAELDARYGR